MSALTNRPARKVPTAALAVALALALGGCVAPLERAEELGGAVLQAKEDASALVVKGCRRYICGTGRIGPVLDEFATPAERAGWALTCAKRAEIPELP